MIDAVSARHSHTQTGAYYIYIKQNLAWLKGENGVCRGKFNGETHAYVMSRDLMEHLTLTYPHHTLSIIW